MKRGAPGRGGGAGKRAEAGTAAAVGASWPSGGSGKRVGDGATAASGAQGPGGPSAGGTPEPGAGDGLVWSLTAVGIFGSG